jgi:hypothetical protein
VEVPDPAWLVVASRRHEQITYQWCHQPDGACREYTGTFQSQQVPGGAQYPAPVRYARGSEYFEVLERFLEKTVGATAVEVIDYLEQRPYLVLSYYLREAGTTAHYLVLVNQQRKVLYHECLAKDRPGIGRDTFFVHQSTLVFVRNSNEFVGIKLKA